jgi:hypothetical protein
MSMQLRQRIYGGLRIFVQSYNGTKDHCYNRRIMTISNVENKEYERRIGLSIVHLDMLFIGHWVRVTFWTSTSSAKTSLTV